MSTPTSSSAVYRNPPSAASSRSTSPASGVRTRTKSIESLGAHPLSSEDNDSTSMDTSASLLTPLDGPAKPPIIKGSSYAVYKPRQRPVSTGSSSSVSKSNPVFTPSSQVAAATTSTSVTPASTVSIPASPGSPNSVTSKLQLQNLQATVQSAGLGHESAGWHIVQKLIAEHDKPKEAAGWDTIYTALKSGRASLLLPRESASLSDITPKFLRDHIILKDGANLVTLSGIRGVKQDDTITFSSCVPGLDLKQAITGDSALFELLGTSAPSVGHSDAPLTFSLGKQIELHIPRQQSTSAVPKIAKPSKPRTLASLFGGNRAAPPVSPNTSPKQHSKTADQALGLAATPVLETGSAAGSSTATMPVIAWSVEHILVGKKLAKAVHQSIESRTKAALEPEDAKVAQMTTHFLNRFHPPYKMLSSASPITEEDLEKDSSTGSLVHAKIEDVTTAMQEFFYDVQLRLEQAEQERAALAEAMTEEETSEKREQYRTASSIDDSLERVEAFVSDMLYDKIFSPGSSSDRQEDESLSTRIAGLHMLDLTLDHLGFQIEAPNSSPEWDDEKRILQEGLEDIVVQCGKELEKLQHLDCRTPLAKLEVLIQTHKIIADSLEQLPPIPMKADGADAEGMTTPGGRRGQVYEMSDDAKSLGGRSARQVQEEQEADLPQERTPRMPSSRPSSVQDASIPAIMLPDAAMKETYPIQTPSAFIDDSPDPTTSSYFEVRSSASSAAIGTVPVVKKASTTSADAILPLLIYAVVRANPSKLVSHTLFVQRFRADSLMRGEGEYCLCNMDAVKSFLMSCDIGSLGLGTDKILTTPDIPIAPLRMRHRTAQQLDSMVGSAGKVLGQAADLGLGGYRMLGGLLARNAPVMENQTQPKTLEEVQSVLAGGASKAASFKNSILRRSTISSATPQTAVSQTSPPGKETELADVSQDETSGDKDETEKSADPAPASVSISSRLASLPGLSRLGAQPAAAVPTEQIERPQPATVSGVVPPARTSLLSAFSLPLIPTQSTASNASSTEDTSSLAAPAAAAFSNRRSTISAIPGPLEMPTSSSHTSTAPLLSPTLSQTEAQLETSPPLTSGGTRERTTSFMSHSQHHDYLKTSRTTPANNILTRDRSDSGASSTSNRRMAAFSAVSNLVSNVRHGYTPSVTSISSNAGSSTAAPAIQRFLECEADDLKMSEVALLLADYKRLAAALGEKGGSQS